MPIRLGRNVKFHTSCLILAHFDRRPFGRLNCCAFLRFSEILQQWETRRLGHFVPSWTLQVLSGQFLSQPISSAEARLRHVASPTTDDTRCARILATVVNLRSQRRGPALKQQERRRKVTSRFVSQTNFHLRSSHATLLSRVACALLAAFARFWLTHNKADWEDSGAQK